MADLSDVETALVSAALAALYPAGTDQPSCVSFPVRVFRGQTETATLERDLSSNVANVSVFSMPDTTRNTTRWLSVPSTRSGVATLMVQTQGTSVSFSGLAGAGQIAGVLVDDQAFVHRGTASDTPAVVAAVLAEAIGAVRPCWLSGAGFTVPGAYRVIGRVVADGTSRVEWGRQEQGFCIGNWCATPQQRDTVASVLQTCFSSIAFLPLADGSSGRLRYCSTVSVDTYQAFRLYRRDLVFDVEYGTTSTSSCPVMLFGDLGWAGTTIFV